MPSEHSSSIAFQHVFRQIYGAVQDEENLMFDSCETHKLKLGTVSKVHAQWPKDISDQLLSHLSFLSLYT